MKPQILRMRRKQSEGGQSAKRQVLSSESLERIFGKPGGFRNLRAYRLAELCDDFTCRFCERYIPLSAVDRSVPL